MRSRRGRWVVGAMALATLAVAPTPGTAQALEALESTDRGILTFSYATRPGTRFCGRHGRSISVGEGVRMERGPAERAEGCREDSALVDVTLEGGTVTDVRFLGPGERPSPGARNLGRVSAVESVAAFLSVARRDGPAADEAIVAAVVADSVEVWPDLLAIAQDRGQWEETRKSAIFWLGQEAASSVTGVLVETAEDGSEAQEIREFALSQRPEEESLPALMALAREAEHADTRRSALFWLAQSDDPTVPEFFAEILAGP